MFLIPFILTCYGLTQILVYGTIFDCIRPKEGLLGELFKCPMCVGFHVGWLMALLFGISNLFNIQTNIIDIFILACISSGSSYVLCSLFTDFGINFKINKSEKE
jgi:hypothetical protein